MSFSRIGLYFLLVTIFSSYSIAQTVCTAESKHRLEKTLDMISQKEFKELPINKVVDEVGKWFLETPYVEKTLEVPGDEPLVIDLIGLDCTTYLESIVTLARLAKLNKLTYQDYEKELEFLRYRDGKRAHYPSRLHYFSDWIYENRERGIIQDVTHEAGGIPYKNNPTFMSQNPQYYPQLTDANYIKEISATEQEIASREYHYLPKESISRHEKSIKSGDLIAITIDMDNLDISHVGLAVEREGRIHLMHASSKLKKVVITDVPLADYLLGNKKQSGIMVCRLVEP